MLNESINLLENLKVLGFSPISGTSGIYGKIYDYHNNYTITVNYDENQPNKSIIDYGKDIKLHRGTISNFCQNESLVVLECVNRLLEKGYKPDKIELEKSWLLGHRDKGFLDIWVKDEEDRSFLMIECKTWGAEFDKFVKETLRNKKKNGGQIFSYLHQEPDTKAVCYYASKFNKKSIDYVNAIIYNQEEWIGLSQEERYSRWSLNFEGNGIFEDWVNLYNLESKALLQRDLEPLRKEDSEGIYNKFAEILRHNVVSDKPNAFNKIINLFLCKVYDENRAPDEELKFQIRTQTREKTDEELLEDLNDLYKKGMEAYLQKEVSDYSKEEFDSLLKLVNKDKREELEELYKTLRLYKNNEFAFKEVFDKKSFADNAVVVREVVRLLEKKQLRYTHKQQFLGDFFEKLLNDSIKQEAGQFFTPIPLAQFIVKSLPIENLIKKNIVERKNDALPYVIDYACGAGHFLTETMDEIQNIIKDKIDLEDIKTPSLKTDFLVWKQTQFAWADKYIYGLDLDYRLIKTSKISCFLNGDGLANLIHANGLAPFNSQDYIGLLRNDDGNKNNQKFDILIANPPYSVKAFKNTIKQSASSFDLYDNLTEDSSEIECLFIERAKQLVREGGMVGVVLPVSFLTNGSTYTKAREILLKYFDVKGILALDNNAFMATGTKTIILFMLRRSNHFWEEVNQFVLQFFENYKDVAVCGIEKVFSKYVASNYEDLVFNDYVSILEGKPTERAKESELYRDYESLDIGGILALEKEKLLYFILSYNSNVVVANSGSKDDEKEFLGYEFSNRKGCEGINIKQDENGKIITSLFNEDALDDEKLNYYIYNNIRGENVEANINGILYNKEHPLTGHIDFCKLSDLMDFKLKKMDKIINLNSKKKIKFESSYKLIRLSDVAIIEKGTNITEKETVKGNIPVVAGGIRPAYYHNKSNRDGNVITVSASGAYSGYVNYFNSPIFASDCSTIKSKSEEVCCTPFLYNVLKSVQNGMYALQQGNAQPHVYPKDISLIKVPFPPIDVQKKIVKKISNLDAIESDMNLRIDNLEREITDIFSIVKGKSELLSRVCLKITDGSHNPPKKSYSSKFMMLSAANITGEGLDLNNRVRYISEADFNSENLRTDVQIDDILITIVGTIGRSIIVDDTMPKFTLQRSVAVLKPNKNDICPRFLLLYIKSKVFQDELLRLAHGTSQQGVYLDQLSSIKVPIPSYKEQEDMVKKVLPLEKEIEKLKKEIELIPLKKQAILDNYLS